MNPFLNPKFTINAIKSYLTDIDRLKKSDRKELERYKNKQFKKLLKYARMVPLYSKKYREAGININDINRIEDIKKLPFITKDDLRKNYPDGILPHNSDKERYLKISTSGSTGKPVTIYRDRYSLLADLLRYIRELKEYDIGWRKHRITIISDTSIGAIGSAHLSFSNVKLPFLSFKNFQIIDIKEDVESMMKRMNDFKPELIIGYPDILKGLCILKEKGFGKNVKPLCIQSTGAVLTKNVRKYIEDSFECDVFDSYSSTEAGPTIFECREHNYHIHEDSVYLEFLDENMEYVDSNEPGKLVITRLLCGGTPIIRYTGIDDIIIPTDKSCRCDNKSNLIKEIIGRSIDTIILPNGKIVPPLSLTAIPINTMEHLKSDMIKQFQIIQRKVDEIEVLIVINKECKTKIETDKLFNELKRRFEERLGKDVHVEIKEVDKIEKKSGERIAKQVISLVNYRSN